MMNAMRWAAPALVLLSGCSEQTLSQTKATLTVSPPLLDANEIAVGDSVILEIQMDHATGGDIDINDVVVTNIEGDYFAFEGDPAADLVLGRGEQMLIEIVYHPTDVGYHRAAIDITHSGEGGNDTRVDARGRGMLPDATLWPLGIDFGPVAVGETEIEPLEVQNLSDLDLVIDSANFSNANVFALSNALPITIQGGNLQQLNVTFTPQTENPETGTLTLRAGEVALPAVALRGNDCENGTPGSYDQDGDGYTTCGGDCDDLVFETRPGVPELPNWEDDDCDGTTDEGTIYYDDDGDGFCEGPECSDGTTPGDCNDGRDDVYPGPIENEIMDNGIDDNCDGIVDQGSTDLDGDGYSPDPGGDCNDNDADIHPGAPELPDAKDNDCDNIVDEGTILYDDDGDTFCEGPAPCTNAAHTPGDCDDDTLDAWGNGQNVPDGIPDGRPTWPGAVEIPDWRDNDCDGTVDEGTDNYDDDGDGYTEYGGDCDDTDPSISPAQGNC